MSSIGSNLSASDNSNYLHGVVQPLSEVAVLVFNNFHCKHIITIDNNDTYITSCINRTNWGLRTTLRHWQRACFQYQYLVIIVVHYKYYYYYYYYHFQTLGTCFLGDFIMPIIITIASIKQHTRCLKNSSPPKTFIWNIITSVKYFCMKFCKFIGNSYPHISTNICRVILIFHQMA